MSDVNWWLMLLSFVLGLILSWLWFVRRVTREVPRTTTTSKTVGGGLSAGTVGTGAAVAGAGAVAGGLAAKGFDKGDDLKTKPFDQEVDTPKVDAPKVDTSWDAPKVDAPDVDAPTVDTSWDAPKVDAPDVDAPDVDAPKVDTSWDAPKVDTPSADVETDGPGLGTVAGAAGAGAVGGYAASTFGSDDKAASFDTVDDGTDKTATYDTVGDDVDKTATLDTVGDDMDKTTSLDTVDSSTASTSYDEAEDATVKRTSLNSVDEETTDTAKVSGDDSGSAAGSVAAGAAGATAVGAGAASVASGSASSDAGGSIKAGKFGDGSAEPNADGSGPSGWAVKGNEDSMLYHTEQSPSYKRTKAEVWFRDEDAATKAGFTRWDRKGGATGGGAASFADVPAGKFGPGSADPSSDGSGPSGWAVKGNEDSMLYHTEESPSYKRTKAEIWFQDEETAQKAGFTRWDHKQKK